MSTLVIRRALLLIAFLACSASQAAGTQPVVELYPGEDGPADLTSYVSYKELAPDETMLEALATGGFVSFEGSVMQFGRAGNSVLVLFEVENRGSRAGEWVLSTGRVAVLALEFCQLNGSVVLNCFDSINSPEIAAHLKKYHSHALEFSLEAGEKRLIALRYQGSNISVLYPEIRTPSSHQKMIDHNFLVVAVATTATLALIVLNAGLFLLIRNTAFGYFVLAEFAFLYQSLHLINYTAIFVFPHDFELNGFFSSLAHICFGIFSVRFAQVFLDMKQAAPRLNNALRIFILMSLVILGIQFLQLAFPFTTSRNVVFLSVFVSTLASVILPFVGVWAVIRYGLYYVPLMVSWLILGGTIFWVTLSAMSVFEGAHDLRYWSGSIGFAEALFISISIALSIRAIQNRELKAQRRLAAELKEKLALVERSSELTLKKNLALTELADKGRLLLSAGHDAKNFLGSLRYAAASIRTAQDLQHAQVLGGQISESAELLNQTLSAIIYSSSAGASSGDILALEMLEVASLLTALKMMHQQAAAEKGLTLVARSAVSHIPGDRTLVARIVSNLISNAIKYSSHGRILIASRLRGSSVLIQVYDQGPGIDDQALAALLDPASERIRLDGSVVGEGAGLEICHHLARRLGGKISAWSVRGRGSRFELELPAVYSPAAAVSCMFAPADLLGSSSYAELQEVVDVVDSEAALAAGQVNTLFLRTGEYQRLDKLGLLSEVKNTVLVADDRSIEFRETWFTKSEMIIYSPLDEGLVLSALALLAISK